MATPASPPPTSPDPYAQQYGTLGQQINLPGMPSGSYDSQYYAQAALLRQQTAQQYADILQQLGYTDANGNFVMGDVEAQANHDKAVADYQRQLAIQQNTEDMARNGTLFSGYRGTMQARAEHPYVQQIADIDVATPKQLSKLFEQASGLVNSYVLQNNQLLADAATRAAQAALQQSYYSGGGGVDTTTPATPTTSSFLQHAASAFGSGLQPGTPINPARLNQAYQSLGTVAPLTVGSHPNVPAPQPLT